MAKEFMCVKDLIKLLLDHNLDDIVYVGDKDSKRLESSVARLVIRKKGFFEKVK